MSGLPPAKKRKKSSSSLFGFFKHKDPAAAKKPRRRYRFEGGSIALPALWFARDDSLLVRRMEGCNFHERRVAAFDFDGCLTTDSGPIGSNGSGGGGVPIRDGVIEKLRALYDGDATGEGVVGGEGKEPSGAGERHRLVVFTNGANIGNMRRDASCANAVARKTGRLNEFARRLQRPLEMFVATKKDHYRKGVGTGFWDALLEDPNLVLDMNAAAAASSSALSASSSSSSSSASSSAAASSSPGKVRPAAPDLSVSFFVGDAAGRDGDFSDSDKAFAEAVGLRFFNETQFFGQKKQPVSSATVDDLRMQIFGCSQLLVVLVGAPGSGKSEFCKAMLNSATTAGCDRVTASRWSVVCQDELKSREACIRSCEELLGLNKCVVIDRTNISTEQRAHWTFIAKNAGVPCIAIELGGQERHQLIENVLSRPAGSHGTRLDASSNPKNVSFVVSKFLRAYQQTSLAEGFDLVFRCGESLEERGQLVAALRNWATCAVPARAATRTVEIVKSGRTLLVPTLRSDVLAADALPVLWDAAKAFLTLEENAALSIEVLDTTQTADESGSGSGSESVSSPSVTNDLDGRLVHIKGYTSAQRELFPAAIHESRANMVATPAVFKFANGGHALNRQVHRCFNAGRSEAEAAGVRNRNAMDLRNLTGEFHGSCRPGVYPCAVPESNSITFTHIFHCVTPRIVAGSEEAAAKMTEHYRDLFAEFRKKSVERLSVDDISASSSSSSSSASSSASSSGGVGNGSKSSSGGGAAAANSPDDVSDLAAIGLAVFPAVWSEPLDPPPRTGNWRSVLDCYVSPTRNGDCQRRVFLETARYVCIYDGYPKGKIHLLVVPKPDFLNIKYPSELNATHCERLAVLHSAAKAIARQVRRRFMDDLSPGHIMKVGYHHKPSLSRMHIHLISDDLSGRGMKTKKHRDSFATDFFVPVDTVMAQARRKAVD